MSENSEKNLIKACLKNNRSAQNELYRIHAPKLMGLCLRYAKNRSDAEDMLSEGFFLIFRDLHQYKGTAPLFSWMRKIVIHSALRFLKKQKSNLFPLDALQNKKLFRKESDDYLLAQMEAKEIILLLQKLPLGYRTILNLYAIEGYKHKEIAEMLHISEGTSKSQLSRARAMMTQLIETHYTYKKTS